MFSPTSSQMFPTNVNTASGIYPVYPPQTVSPVLYQSGYSAPQSTTHPLQQNMGVTVHPTMQQFQTVQSPPVSSFSAPEGYSFVSVPTASYAPQPQFVPMVPVSSPPQSYQPVQPVYYSTTNFSSSASPQLEDRSSLKAPSQDSTVVRSNSKSSVSIDGSEVSEEVKDGASVSTKDDGKDGCGSDYDGGSTCTRQVSESGDDSESRSIMGSPQKTSPLALDAFIPSSFPTPLYKSSVLQPQRLPSQYTTSTAVNFMMGFPESRLLHPSLRAEDPAFINFLRRQTNLHHYMNRLREKTEAFRIPEKPKKTRPTSKERQEELFKTELCNAWINGQKCRFGKKCIFAHGTHEIRQPKRKIERMKKRAPIQKMVVSGLNKLTEENFSSLSTEMISRCVEELSDLNTCKLIVQAIYNKAVWEIDFQTLYSKFWHKLINIHHLKQYMKKQMRDFCLWEYASGNKSKATGAMSWIAELVKKGLCDEEVVHKILDDMTFVGFGDKSDATKLEYNLDLWCHLLEGIGGSLDQKKIGQYFTQMANFKSKVGARYRFRIMDLEDLRQRNWEKRL